MHTGSQTQKDQSWLRRNGWLSLGCTGEGQALGYRRTFSDLNTRQQAQGCLFVFNSMASISEAPELQSGGVLSC